MSKILLTGGAGFIGSHLADALVAHPQVEKVRILDNLATGSLDNIKHLMENPKVEWLEGDIRDFDTCLRACEGIQLITHQAALGSVPRSMKDPLTSNAVNVTGTLNIFQAAVQQKAKRVVYAASSSTYGDSKELPKQEGRIGKPLSPYAVTKLVNEVYADVYGKVYGLELIGLRYFNVFGPRQNPKGPYAAVIPLFVGALLRQQAPTINGDGTQSRDFTYVANAVQANIKGLFAENPEAVDQVYNVACGEQTDLNQLYANLAELTGNAGLQPNYGPPRPGDVKHSLADISKAGKLFGYQPEITIKQGLKTTVAWFTENQWIFG